jgi:hypothetical protein
VKTDLKELITENFIQESYSNSILPPLWQVIYQEGMRDNHLLFAKKDLIKFQSEARFADYEISPKQLEDVQVISMKLAECADLNSMISIIDEQGPEMRLKLYVLYIRLLKILQGFIKSKLH